MSKHTAIASHARSHAVKPPAQNVVRTHAAPVAPVKVTDTEPIRPSFQSLIPIKRISKAVPESRSLWETGLTAFVLVPLGVTAAVVGAPLVIAMDLASDLLRNSLTPTLKSAHA